MGIGVTLGPQYVGVGGYPWTRKVGVGENPSGNVWGWGGHSSDIKIDYDEEEDEI